MDSRKCALTATRRRGVQASFLAAVFIPAPARRWKRPLRAPSSFPQELALAPRAALGQGRGQRLRCCLDLLHRRGDGGGLLSEIVCVYAACCCLQLVECRFHLLHAGLEDWRGRGLCCVQVGLDVGDRGGQCREAVFGRLYLVSASSDDLGAATSAQAAVGSAVVGGALVGPALAGAALASGVLVWVGAELVLQLVSTQSRAAAASTADADRAWWSRIWIVPRRGGRTRHVHPAFGADRR